MAVCRQQRILQHVAQDFRSRQIAGVKVLPMGEQFARSVLTALFQGLPDGSEVVAELPKTKGEVQDQHIKSQGQYGAVGIDGDEGQRHQDRGRQDRDAPNHARMHGCAGIEIAPRPTRPRSQGVVDRVEVGERFELLDQQGQEHGKETHAQIISGGSQVGGAM